MRLTILDPQAPDARHDIDGDGTEARTLLAAGILGAAGIIAGRDNDTDNLSIAMTASELKPDLFVVIRQNQAANGGLFAAYGADFTMIPSRIVAREAIAILTTPLLAAFMARLDHCDEAWCLRLVERLQTLAEGRTPHLWSVELNAEQAPAAWRALLHDTPIPLGELLRDGRERSQPLPVVALLCERANEIRLLPGEQDRLQAGDRLLLAGPLSARRNLELTLHLPHELHYVLTGEEDTGTWLAQRLIKHRRPHGAC